MTTQVSRQVSHGSYGDNQADEQQVSRASGGDYQADEQAGVEQLRWRLSGRRAGRCRTAHMETIKQMSRQVFLGSDVDDQADEQAGVARLSCRLSIR